jgi:hypothetical protein
MKKIIIYLTFLLTITNCNNNDNALKEKELELKERELDLKEKELAQNQNDKMDRVATADQSSDKSLNNSYPKLESTGGQYIPENEISQTASFILEYSQGANRPSCEIQFQDGFNVFVLASCEGDYFWCLRDENNNEFGSMKLSFSENGDKAEISIKTNENSSKYKKYLDKLKCRLNRI